MPLDDPSGGVTFTNELVRSDSAEKAVFTYPHSDRRDLKTAVIKCTPARLGAKSWHKGGTDPNAREHLTVEYKDSNGNHVTTKHIDRSGRAC